MKNIYSFFDKQIVGGKGFLAFSIFVASIVRVLYLFYAEPINNEATGAWLWKALVPLFNNQLVSVLVGSIFLAVIALLVHNINVKFTLIRRKTLLPPAIVLLLFSCSPSFLIMSPLCIAVLTVLVVVNDLFEGYNSTTKQRIALRVTFQLSMGSLFVPIILIYIPILWLCLQKVRCFNFKAFLASIFGILLVYIPTTSIFLFSGEFTLFLEPFISLVSINWAQLPVLNYTPIKYIFIGILLILFFIIAANNHINRHKDKVSTRIYIYNLTNLVFFSILSALLINLNSGSFIAIAFSLGAILLGHFFALTEQKSIIILFFILLALLFIYLIASFSIFN